MHGWYNFVPSGRSFLFARFLYPKFLARVPWLAGINWVYPREQTVGNGKLFLPRLFYQGKLSGSLSMFAYLANVLLVPVIKNGLLLIRTWDYFEPILDYLETASVIDKSIIFFLFAKPISSVPFDWFASNLVWSMIIIHCHTWRKMWIGTASVASACNVCSQLSWWECWNWEYRNLGWAQKKHSHLITHAGSSMVFLFLPSAPVVLQNIAWLFW